jgi:hypothetical protein
MVNSSSRSATAARARQERGAHAVGHGAKAQVQARRLHLVIADRWVTGQRARGDQLAQGLGGKDSAGHQTSPSAPDTNRPRMPIWQAGGFSMVGPERFELSTSRPPDGRANQAALRPDTGGYIPIFRAGASGKAHHQVPRPVPPSACSTIRARSGQTAGKGGDGSASGLQRSTGQRRIRAATVTSSRCPGSGGSLEQGQGGLDRAGRAGRRWQVRPLRPHHQRPR